MHEVAPAFKTIIIIINFIMLLYDKTAVLSYSSSISIVGGDKYVGGMRPGSHYVGSQPFCYATHNKMLEVICLRKPKTFL